MVDYYGMSFKGLGTIWRSLRRVREDGEEGEIAGAVVGGATTLVPNGQTPYKKRLM